MDDQVPAGKQVHLRTGQYVTEPYVTAVYTTLKVLLAENALASMSLSPSKQAVQFRRQAHVDWRCMQVAAAPSRSGTSIRYRVAQMSVGHFGPLRGGEQFPASWRCRPRVCAHHLLGML